MRDTKRLRYRPDWMTFILTYPVGVALAACALVATAAALASPTIFNGIDLVAVILLTALLLYLAAGPYHRR